MLKLTVNTETHSEAKIMFEGKIWFINLFKQVCVCVGAGTGRDEEQKPGPQVLEKLIFSIMNVNTLRLKY